MLYCSNCGTKCAENARFCTRCGSRVGVASTYSGAPVFFVNGAPSYDQNVIRVRNTMVGAIHNAGIVSSAELARIMRSKSPDISGFGGSILTCFSKYGSTKGRASRSEFWYWVLFILFVCSNFLIFRTQAAEAAGFIDSRFGIVVRDTIPLCFCLFLANVLIPTWAVFVRRLHDANLRGMKLALLVVIFLLAVGFSIAAGIYGGIIFIGAMLSGGITLLQVFEELLRRGTSGWNVYGREPRKRTDNKSTANWSSDDSDAFKQGDSNDQDSLRFGSALAICFKKYFNFKGRASRAEFWSWILFLILANFASVVVVCIWNVTSVFKNIPTFDEVRQYFAMAYLCLLCVLVPPTLSVYVRRLHDVGRSSLFLAIPGVLCVCAFVVPILSGKSEIFGLSTEINFGIIVQIFLWIVCCLRGTEGKNRFGLAPNFELNRKRRHKEYEEYKRKAEAGDASGQCNLGRCYEYGRGVEKDYQAAFEQYRKAAEQGYAQAQYKLGACYSAGQGVEKDCKAAFDWYCKAADQEHAQAQCELGEYYTSGTGVEQDYHAAFEQYRKAAEQGYAPAQSVLSWFYLNGQGVERDENAGFMWLLRAVEQGYANAEFFLGMHYLLGRNPLIGIEWIRTAAEHGERQAQYILGDFHAKGIGVRQDFGTAAMWFHKAAVQGSVTACRVLAEAYGEGLGVQKNLTKATEYKKLAEEAESKYETANVPKGDRPL